MFKTHAPLSNCFVPPEVVELNEKKEEGNFNNETTIFSEIKRLAHQQRCNRASLGAIDI